LAHKESDAYLNLHTDAANHHVMHGQWDIAMRDLDYAIGMVASHDGAITWGDVQARRKAIEDYALSRLQVKGDGLTCTMQPTGQKIDDHTDGAYDVIFFDAVCDKNIPSKLTIVYNLMYDLDPYHRGIVTIHADGKVAGAVLGPEHPVATLDMHDPDRWGEFKSFLVDGIWHNDADRSLPPQSSCLRLNSGVTTLSKRSAVQAGCLSFHPLSTSRPSRSMVKLTGKCQIRP